MRRSYKRILDSKSEILVAFALVAGIFFGACGFAQSLNKSGRTPSEKEYNLMIGKMKAVDTSRDPVETSKLISSLKDFPYRMVLNFLMAKLKIEVAKPKPNSFHISEYLNGIGSMGSVAEVEQFNKIYEKFRASTAFNAQTKNKLDDLFLEIRERIRSNPTPLPVEQTASAQDGQSFKDQLLRDSTGAEGEEKMAAAKIILTATTNFMTDEVKKSIENGSFVETLGRDKEAERALDTLVRIKGKNPVFIGIPGVGKTAAAERVAQILVEHLYPDTEVFNEAFDNAEMIQVTPARISRLAKSNDPNSMAEAVEQFFDAVLFYEQSYAQDHNGERKPIIVFVDEFHTFNEAQIEALLPYMDARDRGITILGASNSDKFQNKFKDNEALLRRVEQIGLTEFDEATTIRILKASWVPVIEKKYNVEFTDDAIEAAVKVAPLLQPDTARPDGPFKVLQGLAIHVHRLNDGAPAKITDSEIYDYAKEITGLPANPHDGKAFQEYLAEKEKEIDSVVVEQKSLVHKLVERVGNLLIGTPRRPQVMAIIGTTGTGKTLIAETLAEKVFGSKRRALIIDGNTYQTGDLSVNTLVGSPNGTVTSDKRSGILCEYLDDPSRGKMGGVIVINEAEKMHPDVWKRLMEFFDKGEITCGDGKVRRANRHIVILTSNRGAKLVFPDNITMWSQAEIDRRLAGFKSKDVAALFREKTDGEDKFQLPPEVLGRIDEWAIANPGSREGAIEVARRETEKLQNEMEFEYHLHLDVSPAVVEHLALTGFSVTDGYRQVAKQVDSYLKVAIREARAHWDIPRDGTVKIGLVKNENSSDVKLSVTNGTNSESLDVAAPEQKFFNPLQDKEILEKIQSMPERMKTRIIGQDEAVRSAADAVLSKYADVGRKTAVSFAIVGPTGVGKTELGRAIAEALFGSPDRVEVIPLGNVNFEGRLNDVFNSPAGYVDSHKIGKFERALMNTPNGGVIVFDEFSNMGGGDIKRKEELLKQYFYEILDEGKWTSTATGRTYDLRNHIFEFTGNDLQEFFTSLSTDKLRMDAYNENNKKEIIRANLVKNGIPEAFLGRLADVILAKPLLSTEMKGVTEKELKNQIRRLQEQHVGLIVEYGPKFVENFTRAFFTPDTGGRSVRNALDNRLGALLGAALMKTGDIGHDLSSYVFKLDVQDNLTNKPYRQKKSEPRKVLVGVEVYKDGKKLDYIQKDFTEFAPEVEIPLGKHAETVAYHEAGHAVLNDPELTNEILNYITIRYSRLKDFTGKMITAKGYAHYKPIPGADTNFNYDKTMAFLVKAWGGRVAQELAGLPADIGWQNDLKSMRYVTTEYLTTWGMDTDLVGVQVDKKGNPILATSRQRQLFEQKQSQMISRAHEIAIAVLKEKWPLVRAIVAELMRKGDISESRAQDLEHKIEEKLKSAQQPVRTYEDWQARAKNAKPVSCATLLSKMIRQPVSANTKEE